MTERRHTARRRVCLAGAVRVAAFLPDIPCILRDVSLEGARLRLDPAATLPARFDLAVPCRGETRRVRLIWRVGDAAGVRFAEPEERSDAPASAAYPEASTGPRGRLH